MNEARLLNVEMLYLLWAVPLLVALFLYAARRRKQALERFAESDLLARISNTVDASRRAWKAVLIIVAFALGVIALARPAWNPVEQEVQRRGRDVAFLLDVSKSMLAEDLAPNRLERAKLAILDAVDRLEGDRVALVVFAGTAVVKCPPTHDYGFFRMAVDDVSVDSVSRGGTLIGDAIRTTIEQVFTDHSRGHRDLVLITDGEDHESFPVEAARLLGEMGVRLIAIGLGDENEGRRIPVTGPGGRRTFLTYNGQEVWSRLDADTLRTMVNETPGGRYLNVATGTIDFGDVYLKLIASAEQTELGATRFRQYEEKYQIFLTMAFLLLSIEMALRERRRTAAPLAGIVLLLLIGGAPAAAQSARSLVTEGNKAYNQERFPDALDHYNEAESLQPESPHIWFNKGDALYQQGDFAGAMDAYERAAVNSGNRRLEAYSKYNQGNASFQLGRGQAQANPAEAISALRRSVQYYHDALDADPSISAARHNIEVAKCAIHELLQQTQNQPQQGNQNQDNKDQEDQQQQQPRSGDGQQDQQQQDQQSGDSHQDQQQQQDEQQQQAQQQQQQLDARKAAEKPEDVLDEERENRLRRQLEATVAIQPVDKDW